ncbi:hypothetical protein ACMT8H_000825 [Campylobacter jejuni]
MQPKSIILFFYGYILFFRRQIEFFIFKKIKNSKEFKNYISKLEDRKLPKLFSDEELKVQCVYERI